MKLLDAIGRYLGSPFLPEEPGDVQAYCQGCSKNITKNGGFVSSSGEIYCNFNCGRNLSLVVDGDYSFAAIETPNHYGPEEVQALIKEGLLVNF